MHVRQQLSRCPRPFQAPAAARCCSSPHRPAAVVAQATASTSCCSTSATSLPPSAAHPLLHASRVWARSSRAGKRFARCAASSGPDNSEPAAAGPSSVSPSPSRQPVGAAAPSTSTAALQQRAEAALQAMGGAAGSSGTSTSLSNFQKDLDAVLVPEGGEGDDERTPVQKFLFPDEEELPDNLSLPVWDHLEELRERVAVAGGACVVAIASCFAFSKDLILFLEAPVADAGVRFLQLSPGEFFFTTLKTAGYAGLLIAAPTVLYEIIAYVVPGLTRAERQFLAPIIFGSSILFYTGILFSYEILTPAALNFFVDYADGAVESLWSIDQYFEFVLVLMLSTGLSFQVPVIQVMLGQLGLVTADQMLSQWRYVVVGSTVVAAVLTPSTDPFTQALLAIPLVGLYMGGASVVKVIEQRRAAAQ